MTYPIIAIIDYGSGNLRSAQKAFEQVAPSNTRIIVTADPRELSNASHIVLPGVGAFADCMAGLAAVPDMLAVLQHHVIERKKWFLGICVGMQMLLEHGFEHGEHDGLGWIEGGVVKLQGTDNKDLKTQDTKQPSLKIPHMGWNELHINQPHPLLAGIENGAHAYFVHSYHAQCVHPEAVLASTHYGQKIAAVIARENILGTQFHPEKSQETGLRLIANFLGL